MIVSCGEALIDFVPAHATTGDVAYVPRPGGSPFNTAITLGRLGAATGFLSSISTDFFGAQLIAALRASGVDTRYVSRVGEPTTLAFVNLDSAEPQYAFYDTGAATHVWAPTIELGPEVTTLHLAFGALLPIDEPAGSNFVDLFERNRGRRILTLDPNVRQTVIAGREAAYRARLQTMLALTDVIKISTADLAWLDPQLAPATAAARWLAAGASLVVITAGGDGATAYATRDRVVHCPAQKTVIVDTVGAGDSFMGALLAGLDSNGIHTVGQLADIDSVAIEKIVAFATRVAAITCGRAGADPPWRADVGSDAEIAAP